MIDVAPPTLYSDFPKYLAHGPAVPVYCVTADRLGCMHRYYDTCPFSPSGRLLAFTRFLDEDQLPRPGAEAEIGVVDLVSGGSQIVTTTRAWDCQVGAQTQWGTDDRTLYFNDLDPGEWRPYGAAVELRTGKRRRLSGTITNVSPGGKHAVSSCLLRMRRTQAGYGVHVPSAFVPENDGAPADDGVTITDLRTGESRLLISLADIVARAEPKSRLAGDYYAMHVKWSPQGDRLMLVLRCLTPDRGWNPQLLTLRRDGSELCVAVPADVWARGGNHPVWCPDNERVLMNLADADGRRHFVTFGYDGQGERAITTAEAGRGHPTLHPSGRFILTDAYPSEPLAYGDGTAPVWLINVVSGERTVLARIDATPRFRGPSNEFRLDPHPAWSRDFRMVAFNGLWQGRRAIFVADVSRLVGDA